MRVKALPASARSCSVRVRKRGETLFSYLLRKVRSRKACAGTPKCEIVGSSGRAGVLLLYGVYNHLRMRNIREAITVFGIACLFFAPVI
jgi:hypothetical protein